MATAGNIATTGDNHQSDNTVNKVAVNAGPYNEKNDNYSDHHNKAHDTLDDDDDNNNTHNTHNESFLGNPLEVMSE
nr:hypothetical protein BaRGS_031234 [Batillaria attramentaria]